MRFADLHFYKKENRGQFTSCGTGTMWEGRAMEGSGSGYRRLDERGMLQKVTKKQVEGQTIWALGDAAAWPIRDLIRHFRPELEQRIAERQGATMREAAE